MDFEQKIDLLAQMIANSHNICVFSGAGISVPSGLPDFRSEAGLYSTDKESGYPPEQILSHSFFYSKPKVFYSFYKAKMVYKDAKPNVAHNLFALLEKKGKKVGVITQNIDRLHSLAGSSSVVELHGNVYDNYCTKCNTHYGLDYILQSSDIPYCAKDGAIIKPYVVLYGEQLDNTAIEQAFSIISKADLLIVVGTSLTVHPASSFVGYFKGSSIVVINKQSTSIDHSAQLVFNCGVEICAEQLISKLSLA